MRTRRAKLGDQSGISALVTSCGGTAKFRKRYGNFNLSSLLETAYLSLVTVDESDAEDVVRCFVVCSSGPRNAWQDAEDWLKLLEPEMGVTRTLWVEFVVTEDEALGRELFEDCLKEALGIQPLVDHLLLTTLNGDVPAECSSVFSSKLEAKQNDHFPDVQKVAIYYAPRESLAPTLMMRDAMIEDSDDLVPVFQQQSKDLAATFGEFFLAEMIENQGDDSRSVVATINNRAVGLLSVSTDVDLKLLNDHFLLDTFTGLLRGGGEAAPELEQQPLAIQDDNDDDSEATQDEEEESQAPAPAVLTTAKQGEALTQNDESTNVFALTLFCLEEDYQARASDMFDYMFAQFPEREYCVLSAPHSMPTDVPYLRPFAVARPRLGSTFAHCLFVLHRDTMPAARALTLVRYDPEIHSEARSFLTEPKALDAAGECLPEPLIENPPDAAFVAVYDDTVLAVAVASRRPTSTSGLNWLKENYDVEVYVPFERHRARGQAFLTHFAVAPAFAGPLISRLILGDVMRQYDKTVLYNMTPPEELAAMDILSELVAVQARRRPTPVNRTDDVRGPFLGAVDDDHVGAAPAQGAALHVLTRRSLTVPRTIINARLVVLGATTCAVNFLATLLFEPTVRCSNVTLVAARGLTLPSSAVVDEDFPEAFEFDALGLPHKVKVVRCDDLKSIDRQKMTISLGDGLVVPYDVLVLAPDLEESTAKCLRVPSSDDGILTAALQRANDISLGFGDSGNVDNTGGSIKQTNPAVLLQCDDIFKGYVPASKLDTTTLDNDDVVLVYGGTLEALAAVEKLVAAKKMVKMVVPSGAALDSLGDAVVDRAVRARLEASIEVQFGFEVLTGLEHDGEKLKAAHFGTTTIIPCTLLVGADTLDVPATVFQAINSAGLVYDGRLVVDARFQTTDPNIYAAGPITKFSDVTSCALPKLYHDHANQGEVGKHLAAAVLNRLLHPCFSPKAPQDDLDSPHTTTTARKFQHSGATRHHSSVLSAFPESSEEPVLTPKFERPRTVSAVLPGGLRYVRSRLPSIPADCKVLATGNPDRRYTVVKLSPHGRLVELIYVGQDEVEPRNLGLLVGLQEAYLNSARATYDRGGVNDWITFFRQDSLTAVLHDRFPTLQAALRDILLVDDGARDIVTMLITELRQGKDPDTLRLLRNAAVGTGGSQLPQPSRTLLENTILGYLKKNKVMLPRFQLPTSLPQHHSTSALVDDMASP